MKLNEMTKEQLIEEIKKLKSRKKYGLVWEEKPEDVQKRCRNELPVLEEVTDKAISMDESSPTNLIIEGDNYHALSVLNYTHAAKVDAIYIDPPYNTGAKNWVYNNNFVDANDRYRHSKWLSFMEKRLILAKKLLKDEGIIVVTIDDYEVATLKLLMDDIFSDKNYLGTVVIKNNPQGRSSISGFQVSHEYALFYGKSSKSKVGRLPRTQEQISRYKERDAKGPFEWRNFRAQYSTESPRMKYPIFVKKDCSGFRIPRLDWLEEEKTYRLLETPDTSEIISYPIAGDGRQRTWKWSIDTVKSVMATEMGVRLDKDKKPSVFYKGRMIDEWMLPYTVWDKSEYSASSMGTNLLIHLLGKKIFDYPKSLYAVMDCIKVLTGRKDALILDFFAGSGTTGHAILKLNSEDGGARKFILCTNNENGIAEEVCFPRIKKVIEGYGDVKGIPANVHYFKTAFVSKSKVSDDTRQDLVHKSVKMICVRENTFQKVEENDSYKIYQGNSVFTGILFDLEALEDFKKALNKRSGESHIYVFSLTNDTYDGDFADLSVKHTLCPIPESILEVYRKLFKE